VTKQPRQNTRPRVTVKEQLHQQQRAQLIFEEFRLRARRSRFLAFGILGIIFLLLVGGAAAFVLAPQITLSDFYPDIDSDKKEKELQAEVTKLKDLTATEFSRWMEQYSAYDRLLRKYAKEPQIGRSLTPDQADLQITDSNRSDKDAILKKIDDFDKNKPEMSVYIEMPPGVRAITHLLPSGSVQQLRADLAGGAVLTPPLISGPDRDEALQRLQIFEAALQTLRGQKTERAVANILGRKAAEAKQEKEADKGSAHEVPFAQLVQTNVTRFGTIIMITFLVSILTPLYRYNIRLSTYYDARADVLELLNTKLEGVGFVQLAASLTPSFDFGKAPSTPVEQIVELARQLGDRSKSHGKSE